MCDEFAERGLSGRRLLWVREQRVIHDALDAWLEADDAYRAEYGLRTVATEHRFGPITLTLPDARTLRFRGAVDRVDATDDGRLFVFDYKTSKPYGFDDDDPARRRDPVAAARVRARRARARRRGAGHARGGVLLVRRPR